MSIISLPSASAVKAELDRRAKVARLSDCAHLVSRGLWQQGVPHLELLASWLEDAARGKRNRIIVEIPVRHGKSWTISHFFPVWYLEHWPHRHVIFTAHNTDFAASWGRKVRNTIVEHEPALRVRLADDSTAAYRWHTTEGGGMSTYGVGNPPIGRGANLLIVDDPIQDYEEAYSETWREKLWQWWTSDIYTRLEPGSAAVITMARWHHDDLVGRLRQRMKDGGEHWDILRLPALAEDDDLLGRAPGEALWPERYDKAALEHIRDKGTTPTGWSSLYQQRPEPAEGSLLKRQWFRYYTTHSTHHELRLANGDTMRVPTQAGFRFATVDLAASTKTTGDYTVICVVQALPDGKNVVLHVERTRMEGPDQVPLMRSLHDRYGIGFFGVERIGYQLTLIQAARRAGLPVREINVDKDKVSRALTLAAQLEAGQWFFPVEAPWLRDFEAELVVFPNGAHDDQVDALAYAAISRQSVGPSVGASWIDPSVLG